MDVFYPVFQDVYFLLFPINTGFTASANSKIIPLKKLHLPKLSALTGVFYP